MEKILFTFVTKLAALMRRSTVLSLPLQLVLPVLIYCMRFHILIFLLLRDLINYQAPHLMLSTSCAGKDVFRLYRNLWCIYRYIVNGECHAAEGKQACSSFWTQLISVNYFI